MGKYTIKNVESRAEVLKNDVDNIYRALHTKIGGSPETLDQVPQYILDIPEAPDEEPLTITPSADRQEFYTSYENKYNPITVEPVTSAIDSNIQPENIKAGISILGVTGALPGGNAKLEEVFDVQPTTAEQTIAPREGYVFSSGTVHAVTAVIDKNIQSENIKEGVSILGVAGTLSGGGNAKPEEEFDVQPTTAEQTIAPREGYVFSSGTVRAVTADIDKNIQSENIKEGVTILGVAGTLKEEKPEESFNVQPSIEEQFINPREGYAFSGGVVRAVTSDIDSNIQPGNIKEGISILGVAGTLEEGITPEGTKSITNNGTYDVTTFASVDVNVTGGDTPDYRYMNGTVDREGLKAIGWTDEDILTYEQNIPPHFAWQNDQYKVSDENKALYLLDDPNPKSYKDNPNIEYVPKKNMESYFTKVSFYAGGFQNMKYIKGIPLYDTSNMTKMGSMFKNCSSLITIPQLNTSNVTNMSSMFSGCSSLTTIPLLNTSNVPNMNEMFSGCSSLTTIPQLDTSKATSMQRMFYYCRALTEIPQLDTSNVTDMRQMFYGCSSLTTIPLLNTSNVPNMNEMFRGCSKLLTIPQLDTSNVTNMNGMFQDCSELTAIPQLNTSNVTDMSYMLYYCRALTAIPRLDTSKVTNMNSVFYYCNNLTTVEGIDFSGLTSNLEHLFGWDSPKSMVTRFIVNGKINVSITDDYGTKALTAIDYDSVKSILEAANRTDNTNAKTLAFNRTIADQNGELAALVASCSTKGWTITGLTLQ